MVRIRAGLLHDLDGFIKVDLILHQQADQFRDHHRRVGVINLDCHMLMQPAKVISLILAFL